MDNDWEILSFDFSGFEWDDEKAESNWKKHEVDFDDAKFVFQQPVLAQAQYENGENRWQIIGQAFGRELIVIFAERGEYCRLISARRANRKAQKWYYEIFN